jgi:hypothetical protein
MRMPWPRPLWVKRLTSTPSRLVSGKTHGCRSHTPKIHPLASLAPPRANAVAVGFSLTSEAPMRPGAALRSRPSEGHRWPMANPKPKRVGTLQDLVDQRRGLRLYCTTTGCPSTGREIDIGAVIAQHGDMDLQRFADLSRCSVCGANEPQTVCAPLDTGPRPSRRAGKATGDA